MMARAQHFSFAFLFLALVPSLSQAQQIIRIEEDWELRVVQPDEKLDAPQITTMMVPFGNTSDLLVQFDVNHGRYPAFSAGGVQVRVTNDDEYLDGFRMNEGQRLSEQDETVRWTQVVQRVADGYYFGILNGQSESFGSFGSEAEAAFVSTSSTGGGSLNSYSLEHSLQNSGISYAANRVSHLRLKRVRIFNSLGQSTEFTINRDVLQ